MRFSLTIVILLFNQFVDASQSQGWYATGPTSENVWESECVIACHLCGKPTNSGNKLPLVLIHQDESGDNYIMGGLFLGENVELHTDGFFQVDEYLAIPSEDYNDLEGLMTYTITLTKTDRFIDWLKNGSYLKVTNGHYYESVKVSLIGFVEAFNEFEECLKIREEAQ